MGELLARVKLVQPPLMSLRDRGQLPDGDRILIGDLNQFVDVRGLNGKLRRFTAICSLFAAICSLTTASRSVSSPICRSCDAMDCRRNSILSRSSGVMPHSIVL